MGKSRDWKEYNKELVNRGKLNFWITSNLWKIWFAKPQKRNGRPFIYSDELIKAMLYIRFHYNLSLRATQGFFESFVKMQGADFRVPSYSQLSKRAAKLRFPNTLINGKKVTDLVLDTTGLKMFGAGEWRAEKYGGRKAWKKLHVALDPASGKLVMAQISDDKTHDTTYMERALQMINQKKGKVLFDGIADSTNCYKLAQKYNKQLVTPPKKGAVIREEAFLDKRNEAIRVIRALGNDRLARSTWGKMVGYNRRVIIESAIARWKRLFGGGLRSACPYRIQTEICVKAMMFNEIQERKVA